MIEVAGVYCNINELQLDATQRTELIAIADSITFDRYFTYNKLRGTRTETDNNFVGEIKELALPKWFQTKAKKFLAEGWPVFLKNKGAVPPHIDNTRQCSITIPLNESNTPTIFDCDIKLFHNLQSYLQNNMVKHEVPHTEEDRYFLQISFTKPYGYIRQLL